MCALEERFARHLAPGEAAIARDTKLEFDEGSKPHQAG
jgi:hypothetical protein